MDIKSFKELCAKYGVKESIDESNLAATTMVELPCAVSEFLGKIEESDKDFGMVFTVLSPDTVRGIEVKYQQRA